MTTIERLQKKAESRVRENVRMPIIKDIEELLKSKNIEFTSYLSKIIKIDLSEDESKIMNTSTFILDTTDSYYSANSRNLAESLLKLLKLKSSK